MACIHVGYKHCLPTHTYSLDAPDSIVDDQILRFFCIRAWISTYTQQILIFLPHAAICSPLGTLIMANERFQAQSLIYLHTPRAHNVFLLFLYHWTPFCVHIHLKHNTHSGGIKNDSGITAVPLFTRPSA